MQPQRCKVILPAAHPFEYFRDSWRDDDPRLPVIPHPKPVFTVASTGAGAAGAATTTGTVDGTTGTTATTTDTTTNPLPHPLYFKITLKRSLLGLPWHVKYAAGVLFKKYSPAKRYRPTRAKPEISTNTVLFREASTEVAELIVSLKELVLVENIWTTQQYRHHVRQLLGKQALTPQQLQLRRGYYVLDEYPTVQSGSVSESVSSVSSTASPPSSSPSSPTSLPPTPTPTPTS